MYRYVFSQIFVVKLLSCHIIDLGLRDRVHRFHYQLEVVEQGMRYCHLGIECVV